MTSNFGAHLAEIDLEKIGKLLLSCKKAGVESLKLGELEVKFREGVSNQGNDLNIPRAGQLFEDFTTTQNDEGAHSDRPQPITLLDKSEIFETERVQELIDDPEGYEQRQIDVHLENQRVRENAEV